MILIDYNGIAIGNVITQGIDVDENLIRHTILNSIRMYRSKFKKEYGEIVICCDGGKNWRKEYFPQYKYKRKESREKSKIDWNRLFEITTMVKNELKENFPYKVVDIDECEADDVIAQLVDHTQQFGNYERVMIVSSDKDFAQLQIHDNVEQFSPMKKNFIKEPTPRKFLVEHILKGDASDGVPNVLSSDDCFVTGLRQTPVRKKFIETVLTSDESDLSDVLTEDQKRNYQRNKTLIDLTQTPKVVSEKIINNYIDQDCWSNSGKVLPFLVDKKCKLLIECIEEFIR
jgi:hypothetical protein